MPRRTAGALLGGWLLLAHTASAIILYGTGDINTNTTAPTGALAGSGWQYEGDFTDFLGTAIAPNYFITAEHIGGAKLVGDAFTYQGVSYTTTAAYADPNSDLCIYKVNGTLPSYAPLYTNPGGEAGQGLVVFGRGTQRGSAVTVGSGMQLGGWMWGTSDNVERWGQNTVSQIVTDPSLGSFLYATFDQTAGEENGNEATLSVGDSGGGVFIKSAGGTWELAGINYGVDGPFYTSATGGGGFNGAMFNTTGLYEYDSTTKTYLPANNPSGFYATEIASTANMAFIDSVVPEPSSLVFLGASAGILLGAGMLRRMPSPLA
jgi:hypothetical protein